MIQAPSKQDSGAFETRGSKERKRKEEDYDHGQATGWEISPLSCSFARVPVVITRTGIGSMIDDLRLGLFGQRNFQIRSGGARDLAQIRSEIEISLALRLVLDLRRGGVA